MPTYPRPRFGEHAAAAVLFVALTVLHTWPLAASPGGVSRHDNGDAMLNEWVIAYVAHQLPRAPLALFDAPIFYPEPNTLAFSEHLLVQSLLGAPLLWAGAPTLLVHNLLVLAGFALTGWSMWFVVRRVTGDWAAGALAGMLFAFNAHSLVRIAHLQASHVEFLPLAVLALDAVLRAPAPGRAAALAIAFVLQSLTSNYLLVFTTFGLAAGAAVRPGEWLAAGRRRTLLMLVGAGGLAVVLLAPFLWPYYLAQRQQGLTRELEEVARFSGAWQDYLSASGTVHFRTWSGPFWRANGAPLFPGLVALLLTGVALVTGLAWRDRHARLWLALGVTGFVLSFGASLPGYELLYTVMPLLQGVRAMARFGSLALAGVAALAAFGLWWIRRRTTSPRLRSALTAAALLLVTVEAFRAPVGFERPHNTPRLFYERLADDPGTVVLELPLYRPEQFFRNAEYMLHQTVHWRPLVNGYSGFRPASYDRHFAALAGFPDQDSVSYLRTLGVTHLVVHENRFRTQYGDPAFERLRDTAGLTLVTAAPGLTMFRVEPGPAASRSGQ